MTATNLTIRKRKTLSDQLYGQILEQIVSGALLQGERLPSEQQLCQAFGVSRPVVRESLARLQEDGLLETKHGVGTFIRHRPSQRLLDFAGVDGLSSLMRAIEARMVVEKATARLAAQRAQPDHIAGLEKTLDELDRSMRARVPSVDADYAFHLAIAEAGGNPVFVTMLNAARNQIERIMMVTQQMTRERTEARIERVIWEHRQIFEAIAARDPEGAELTMGLHLLHIRQRVIDCNREG